MGCSHLLGIKWLHYYVVAQGTTLSGDMMFDDTKGAGHQNPRQASAIKTLSPHHLGFAAVRACLATFSGGEEGEGGGGRRRGNPIHPRVAMG